MNVVYSEHKMKRMIQEAHNVVNSLCTQQNIKILSATFFTF